MTEQETKLVTEALSAKIAEVFKGREIGFALILQEGHGANFSSNMSKDFAKQVVGATLADMERQSPIILPSVHPSLRRKN
jgi:hypothetical protein